MIFMRKTGLGTSYGWLMIADIIAEISTMFESVPALYVADGHHRTAAAHIGLDRKSSNSQHNGQEEYEFFSWQFFFRIPS